MKPTTKKNTHGQELIKIDRPDLSDIKSESVLNKYSENTDELYTLIQKTNEPKYQYWDKVKYLELPPGINSKEFWYIVKQVRFFSSTPTIIKAESGTRFRLYRQKILDEQLHKIDINTGGQVFAPYEALSEQNKQKYISRGILEEAIASSQLEGAHTTRQAAKKLILENKEPKNESERMILNNYKTMKLLEDDYKNRELSIGLLFELHANLTKDTLDERDQNRFRKNADDIVVGDDEYIGHIPPKEKFVNEEMQRLVDFANDKDTEGFIHPIIKAILLHFWIGYLHPFVDGNGRLARALFYWYLVRKGYWTIMYIPISSIIKNSPKQYSMAYIYSEQDELDLTYFVDYNIRKIIQAMEEFKVYLSSKVEENKKVDEIIKIHLNDRQKQLIHFLISENDKYSTARSHSTLNSIGRITAMKDLKELEDAKLINSTKVGKFVRYYASDYLKNLYSKGIK